MFTWICPKCGREVPPSYSDCPNCAAGAGEAPATAAAAQPLEGAAETPAKEAVPTAGPVRPTGAAAAAGGARQADAPRGGVPGWAVAIGACLAIALVLSILYLWLLPQRRFVSSGPKAELQPAAARPVRPAGNPFTKHLEVVGLRIRENAQQRAVIKFVVVNHSAAELPPLKGTVEVKTTEGKALFEIPVKLPSLGPFESKELEAQAPTKLRAYELPDWQFLRAELIAEAQ
jgi:hypothetical protein